LIAVDVHEAESIERERERERVAVAVLPNTFPHLIKNQTLSAFFIKILPLVSQCN